MHPRCVMNRRARILMMVNVGKPFIKCGTHSFERVRRKITLNALKMEEKLLLEILKVEKN